MSVGSTMCLGSDEMNMSFIDDFIRSAMKIMLMTINSLQFEIMLPSHSYVIVIDAIVSDVEIHIFEHLKTVQFDTLSKYVLIAKNTVEEINLTSRLSWSQDKREMAMVAVMRGTGQREQEERE
ncbi:hypothetical protein L195_g011149 [Trifolium pratense]|uniref:Uncharacterized protein n=1 Tax=Trifolium pratense TaxID=57577 RepID=A0A2K3PGP8_TRIPR|nr:hypothetical protein L195_g011149 [Trifolium pratense]